MRNPAISRSALFLIIILMTIASPASPAPAVAMDVAILLDTSNSMDGLISQAKSQLWTIVQEFASAEKNGRTPHLRVALFEYGNTNLPVSEGYLRQVVPLSDDLDLLSEALFALRTQGGDEYCGQVIDEAITRLDWSTDSESYRAIFIAGNEPFSQGSVSYRQACERAGSRNIVVNTIHCGSRHEGVRGDWQNGAELGGGEFFNIDQDHAVVHIPCPQDSVIIHLNCRLNETYLWFGAEDKRKYYASNQMAQDSNASLLSSSIAVSRSVTKSGKMYDNSQRDLVDALADGARILEIVPEDELPDVMQEMTPEERLEYLNEMAATRAELKKTIGKRSAEREIYLAEERKRRAEEPGGETLGDAVVMAIRKQLEAAGFKSVGGGGSN